MARSRTVFRAAWPALLVACALTGAACSSSAAPGTSGASVTSTRPFTPTVPSVPAAPSATAAPSGLLQAGAWPGPQPSPAAVARTELAALTVAQAHSMAGYSREKFPHWAAQGNSCDTREKVLARDGQNVTADSACHAVSGTWTSPYDNTVITDSSKVDADHLVPLANAWRSGADTWTTEQRKAFANDLTHPQLLAVSASSNRTKGDQGPEAWKPANQALWCAYARAWTDVKSTYQLAITDTEKTALTQMLDTCPPETPR